MNKKGDNSFLLDQTIQTPSDLNPMVPQGLSNLVMECVSTRPAKRPADMDQIIMRLELIKHILIEQGDCKQQLTIRLSAKPPSGPAVSAAGVSPNANSSKIESKCPNRPHLFRCPHLRRRRR